jgi:hypothetical protein
MSDWSLSIVMIIPADLRDTANRLACALDYDVLPGDTFSVPLSATGTTPATHYGCRSAAKQEFVDMLAAAGQGVLPDVPWADYGLTVDDIPPILASLVADTRLADQVDGHFEAVLAANGLVRVMDDAPAA